MKLIQIIIFMICPFIFINNLYARCCPGKCCPDPTTSLARQSLNGASPAKIAKIAQKKADELAAETNAYPYPYTNAGTYLYPYTNKTKLDEISNKELLDHKRKSK
jgi:hypothetical protein